MSTIALFSLGLIPLGGVVGGRGGWRLTRRLRCPKRRDANSPALDHEPQAQIVVKGDPLAGRSCWVGTQILVGRHDADLVLDDALVSRQHANIRWIGSALQVEDLLSTSGTRVNGARIVAPQRLQHGDVITVDPFAIEVHIAQSSEDDAGAAVAGLDGRP
jgi:hypothetical protein